MLNTRSITNHSLIIFSISLLSIAIISTIGVVDATTENNNGNDNDNTKNGETLKLQIKLNLNNVDKGVKKLKLVSYVNGEAKEQIIDLLKDKSQIKNNILAINLNYDKSNEISSIVTTDQYFVCAYAIKNASSVPKGISFYDCDEGNIGSADSATAHLFKTLNKYNESVNFYKLNGVGKNSLAKEVKLNIKVPMADAGDAGQINVIGMVGGEYKVETINVEEALDKQKNSEGDILDVPFVFNRTTEVGEIQLGDKFFGCVSGKELSPQHSHCEKRTLKDFEKGNQVYSRKDNNFK